MKIEKINDNQIRCTLSKEDLETRNIKISELAYGTGKTRELFQDMMQQANDDFGFEVNDIPLMVEAIPVSPESIILVITKVEDPEETENHLSKFFSKSKEMHDELLSHMEEAGLSLSDFEEIDADDDITDNENSEGEANNSLLYAIYQFETLNEIINIAQLIAPFYEGDSSVYKSPFNNKFYLSLCMESENVQLVNHVCGILTEHAKREVTAYATELYYIEHYEEIISEKAIEKLGAL